MKMIIEDLFFKIYENKNEPDRYIINKLRKSMGKLIKKGKRYISLEYPIRHLSEEVIEVYVWLWCLQKLMWNRGESLEEAIQDRAQELLDEMS